MINSIEIKNFRGINDGKLENLTPLTILVGANGCGKSTVLQSLLLGASADQGKALDHILSRQVDKNRAGEWLFPKGIFRGRSELIVYTPELCKTILFALDNSIEARNLQDPQNLSNNRDFKSIGINIDGSPGSTLGTQSNFLSNIFLLDPSSSSLETPLYTLLDETMKQGRREAVREILQTLVPGMKDILTSASGDRPYVAFEYPNGIVPVLHSGEGISQLVRESLELASRSDGVALMEEPETNKHPAAIFQTAKVIFAAVRRGIQVILTTHSLELIDAIMEQVVTDEELEMVSLFRLQLRNGCLQAVQMNGKSIAESRFEIESDIR